MKKEDEAKEKVVVFQGRKHYMPKNMPRDWL